MIYQKMESTLEVEWLDPEGSHKAERKERVKERLLKMFGHEFAKMTIEKHGIKIEITHVDGERVRPSRETKETSAISSSDREQEVGQSGQ